MYDILDDTARGFTGEYGQLNIYDETLKKFVLFLPLETLPSVVGSPDTIENDVTTSRVKGKIKGKMTIEDKEIQFLWHRDNIERLNKYLGKQCKFLVSYKDGTGWQFSGSYTYKPDDASSSEKATGTITLVASQADQIATSDVRDLMAKTCAIINSDLPEEIELDTSGSAKFNVQTSSAVSNVTCESNVDTVTAQYSEGVVTVTASSAPSKTYGVLTLTPKASGEASWVSHVLFKIK